MLFIPPLTHNLNAPIKSIIVLSGPPDLKMYSVVLKNLLLLLWANKI